MTHGTDMFAYLAAFVTITLALALGDMVQSLHRLLRARARVRWHVLPLVTAAFVLLSVLSEFFSLWEFRNAASVSFYGLVGLVMVPALMALAACAALPDDVPEDGIDLGVFHMANRRYLFSVLALAFAADLVRIWLPELLHGRPIADMGAFLATSRGGVFILLLSLLAWTARPRVHAIGLIALLVLGHLSYAGWTIVQS